MNAMTNMYKVMASMEDTVELSRRVLKSIELYIEDAQNTSLDASQRWEAGLNAITLTQELSNNIRNDLAEDEQIILIKVCGQIIKSVHKYMRDPSTDLSKELAGVRLIRKLIS